MSLDRLSNRSNILLKDKAYMEIKELILNEEFKPSQFLSEKVLIDLLGMSKTPIKSALDRLETEGFITVWPKQGILVNELSITKIKDIYELRMALELLVCQKVAGKLTELQCEEIEENLRLQAKFAHDNNEIGYTKADADFHLLLCKYSMNDEILQIMSNYQEHLYRSALQVMRRISDRMVTSLEEHRNIYQEIKKGNTENVEKLIKEHLTFGLKAHYT
ncbi:GntR family transcriptional regulator [Bacillus sp. FJAT-50079]|uniref:GntR family transcriptional regulator n=1 Tax=Bacillus sp. FJAT-50079 TaxID=2833577 RepID=UPI001BC930E5|nr:GntR family transcriptional regulator [Bacillus sp. FJAT-50079]MBS4208120.1 GntR family transcriptional regulator [Bacillus sp. FJAT-50079]